MPPTTAADTLDSTTPGTSTAYRIDPDSATLDPTTFEILVNRLRSINDSQALVAKRISGSPIIYESSDFNCAIMDPAGDTLFLGHYNLMLGASLDLGVKWIIEHYSTSPGIHPGDVFYHNDPWIGTVHQQDGVALAPVFIDGLLVCWVGMSMHELDVGGIVPGSFAVGASETFAESSIITPVKLVEAGVLRPDVERAIVRNSRLPNLLSLNLRARLGAFNFAARAINDIADKYGLEVLAAALAATQKYVVDRLAVRLDAVPDGQWRNVMYIDGDGTTTDTHRAELTLTKHGRQLHFDFRGTSPQARGGINITRAGLLGAVNIGLLCTLCYDLPWTTSAFQSYVSVEIDDATMFSAQPPAPVSGGTVSCGSLAATIVQSSVAEMLLGSADDTIRQEAMAVWQPLWNGTVFTGVGPDGHTVTGVVMDGILGGEGAATIRDGQDVAGRYTGISLEAANVERNERVLPILQLSRQVSPESCGHGQHRGGAGAVIMMTPHKAQGPLQQIVYSAYQEQTIAGLAGGYGPAVQGNIIARGTDIQSVLAGGRIPTSPEELVISATERLASKCITELVEGDVHLMFASGGGGFGDPLRRDLGAVERDVHAGRYGRDTAHGVYGCVLAADGTADIAASTRLRDEVRTRRLRDSAPARALVGDQAPSGDGHARSHRCGHCGHDLGTGDPRRNCAIGHRAARELSPLNEHEATDAYRIWEFYCPACATMFATLTLHIDDPIELAFGSPAAEASPPEPSPQTTA